MVAAVIGFGNPLTILAAIGRLRQAAGIDRAFYGVLANLMPNSGTNKAANNCTGCAVLLSGQGGTSQGSDGTASEGSCGCGIFFLRGADISAAIVTVRSRRVLRDGQGAEGAGGRQAKGEGGFHWQYSLKFGTEALVSNRLMKL